MAAVTSSVSTSGHLADTVKAATDAEDIVPLVRICILSILLRVQYGLSLPNRNIQCRPFDTSLWEM